MKQIKEDTEKNKQAELRRSKEIAQLRKEQLKKEGLIRNLEKEKRQKDVVLKRKQEEVIIIIHFVGVASLWGMIILLKIPGHSCSKLTTSLVYDWLKFQMAILQIHCYFFVDKMWVAKHSHILSTKI